MAHELHVIAGDDKGRVLRIDDDKPLIIGRSRGTSPPPQPSVRA